MFLEVIGNVLGYLTTKIENHSYRKIVQPFFLDTGRLWVLAAFGAAKEKKKKIALENERNLNSGHQPRDAD